MSSDAWRGLDKLQLYEELALLKEIRGNFLSVIALLKKEGQNIVIVDATGDIQSVGREILKSVTKIVQAPNRSERSNRNSASRQIAAILEGNAISS
jgi:ABC-type hemin transport system substrate-binding protein